MTVEARAPDTIWPSPPMLITLARKAMVMPTPTSSRGVDLMAVSTRAPPLPKAPLAIAQYPVKGLAPKTASITAPIANAPSTASIGTL